MKQGKSDRFAGRTALVTGGAAGIGWATATSLLEDGARVAICSRKGVSLDQARKRAAEIDPDNLLVFEADVSSETDIFRLFEDVGEAFGSLDFLVNNAGIDSFQKLDAFSLERYRKVMDVNVTSLFLAVTAALPLMRSVENAAIVTIGSIHGHITTAGRSDYVTSKAALIGATRALALDLAPEHIRINLVSPGAIETPMLLRGWAVKAPEADPDTLRTRAGALHPCGRIGQPEDIASAIKFLLGDEAGFINGTELLVDGGLACKLAMTSLWED
jgi:NAD(P)-dependent dehydrogenase (short-subunit alcohol dehydrogenase family)